MTLLHSLNDHCLMTRYRSWYFLLIVWIKKVEKTEGRRRPPGKVWWPEAVYTPSSCVHDSWCLFLWTSRLEKSDKSLKTCSNSWECAFFSKAMSVFKGKEGVLFLNTFLGKSYTSSRTKGIDWHSWARHYRVCFLSIYIIRKAQRRVRHDMPVSYATKTSSTFDGLPDACSARNKLWQTFRHVVYPGKTLSGGSWVSGEFHSQTWSQTAMVSMTSVFGKDFRSFKATNESVILDDNDASLSKTKQWGVSALERQTDEARVSKYRTR